MIMKHYIQFYVMGTGYIQGTIPPQFDEPVPVAALGSGGFMIPDQRLGLTKLHELARSIICNRKGLRQFIGYSIEPNGQFIGYNCNSTKGN